MVTCFRAMYDEVDVENAVGVVGKNEGRLERATGSVVEGVILDQR